MSTLSLHNIIKSLEKCIPEIPRPSSRISFTKSFWYTVLSLLLYLICSQIPLLGISREESSSDSLSVLRLVMASSKDSLMELGISPIVTTGTLLQILRAFGILEIGKSKEEKRAHDNLVKILGLTLSLCEALLFVVGGKYGAFSDLGFFVSGAIVLQLFIGSLIILLLNEFFNKGYALGSAISLFTAAHIAESIFWKILSPMTINDGSGLQFEGIFLSLVSTLIGGSSLSTPIFRTGLPNLFNLLATLLIFASVIFLQGVSYVFYTKRAHVRSTFIPYPLKLMYTSTMPIVIMSNLVSMLHFISRVLYFKFGGFFLVRALGVWTSEVHGRGQYNVPTSGLSYYINSPSNFGQFLEDPLYGFLYIFFMLSSSAFFSLVWMYTSGSGPTDVAQRFKEQKLVLVGHSNPSVYLSLTVPKVALLGGLVVGILSITADLMGAIGSGTGILLLVMTISEYREIFKKEKKNLRDVLYNPLGY